MTEDTTRRLRYLADFADRNGRAHAFAPSELLRTAAKEIQLLRGACLVACLVAGGASGITLAVLLW